MSFFDRAKKIFCLPVLPAILLVLSAAALLVCVFSEAIRGPVIYAVYLYFTYALGAAVCAIVLAMASYMIVKPTRELQREERS